MRYRFLPLFYAGLLLLFFLSRLAFLAAYALPWLTGAEVFEAFRLALRLDAAAAAVLLVPLLAASLPLQLGRPSRGAVRLAAVAAALSFCFAFAVCVSDYLFYGERNKHLEEEFFMYWNAEGVPGVAGAFAAHPLLISSSLVLLLLLFVLLKAAGTRGLSAGGSAPVSLLRRLALLFLAVLLLLLLFRGVGSRPLRSGQLLGSSNPMVNAVAVNPVYNVLVDGLRSFLEEGPYRFYDPEEAVATTQEMLRAEGEAFADPRYPLLRTLRSGRAKRLRNVVIVQLEGVSNSFIGHRRGGREVTPFLNDLARTGTYFPLFIQNVRFTHRALFVINSGHPDRATVRTILKSPEVLHGFSSLGATLGGEGYDLIYVEGGDSDYESMRGFLERQGYAIFDGKSMDRSGRYDGIDGGRDPFGWHDDLALAEAVYRFERARRPFLGYVMLHSTHSPWRPPKYFQSSFESPYGVFEYTDWAVGRFFEALEEKGLLEETLIVITADHTSLPVRDMSHLDHMNIPLIIAGGGAERRRRWTIGSQVDILPTVLGLLGLDVPCGAMGRDLMRVPEGDGFAGSIYNGYAFWYEGDWILKDWLDDSTPPELYRRSEARADQTDVAAGNPETVRRLQRRFRSYYETSRLLSLEDRIFPGKAAESPVSRKAPKR